MHYRSQHAGCHLATERSSSAAWLRILLAVLLGASAVLAKLGCVVFALFMALAEAAQRLRHNRNPILCFFDLFSLSFKNLFSFAGLTQLHSVDLLIVTRLSLAISSIVAIIVLGVTNEVDVFVVTTFFTFATTVHSMHRIWCQMSCLLLLRYSSTTEIGGQHFRSAMLASTITILALVGAVFSMWSQEHHNCSSMTACGSEIKMNLFGCASKLVFFVIIVVKLLWVDNFVATKIKALPIG